MGLITTKAAIVPRGFVSNGGQYGEAGGTRGLPLASPYKTLGARICWTLAISEGASEAQRLEPKLRDASRP